MMPPQTGRGAERGAALLDAVIGLAVLAVAATLLIGSASQAVRQARAAESHIEAVTLAARLIDTVRTFPADRLEPLQTGLAGRYRWTRTVTLGVLSGEDGANWSARLDLIEVQVNWEDGGRERSTRLSLLKAEPAREK